MGGLYDVSDRLDDHHEGAHPTKEQAGNDEAGKVLIRADVEGATGTLAPCLVINSHNFGGVGYLLYTGNMNKAILMKQIHDQLLNLKSSPLYQYRVDSGYYPVVGEGDVDATVMLIGEAPGETEAKTARPFCGASGRILDQLLASVDLDRDSVYVTNVVKDRPPKNRDPKPEEIELYTPFLTRQIDIIQPQIVATLGRFGMEFMFSNYANNLELITKGKNKGKPKLPKISEAHGKTYDLKTAEGTAFKLVPLYHPAVSLYNPKTKTDLLDDFKILAKLLG